MLFIIMYKVIKDYNIYYYFMYSKFIIKNIKFKYNKII